MLEALQKVGLWCWSAGWGATYVELLPEELAIVSRAEPELFLQAVHGDGEVGPGGRRGSGEQHHSLLFCNRVGAEERDG